MGQHLITPWQGDKPVEVTVYQESGRKTVWFAYGQYMGKELRVQGRSESDAKNRWKEAAHFKGNG